MDIGSRVTVSLNAQKWPGYTGVIVDIMNDGKFVVELGNVNEYPYAFYTADQLSLTKVTVKKISHHPNAWQ